MFPFSLITIGVFFRKSHSVGTFLFSREEFGLILAHGQERTPGNTIRKVYLCRAKITRLRPGDLLLFYMSKDVRYAASRSITTVGIVEQVIDVTTVDDLIRTAKRSVFIGRRSEWNESFCKFGGHDD